MSARHQPIPKGERGSALLAALCCSAILALAVASYAGLCYVSLKASTRALESSRALELAETGLEEALWALNNNGATASNWETTLWTPFGSYATKTMSGSSSEHFSTENGTSVQIKVKITNYLGGIAGTPVIITSTGIVTAANGSSISRALQCTAQHAPLFKNAVGATSGPVVFSAGGSADSYDSTFGYNPADPDPAKRPGYSATIASGLTVNPPATPPIQLNAAHINGYVVSTIQAAAPSYDLNSTTGAVLKGPNSDPMFNVDTTRLITMPASYQSIFQETPIAAAPSILDPAAVPSVLTSGNYYILGDVTLTTPVTISGSVTLYIAGALNLNTGSQIVVDNTTDGSNHFVSSLELHVTGSATDPLDGFKIDGGGIDNQTKLPKRLAIFSSTPNPSEMATNTPFYGTIYAPNSSLTISHDQQIYGSLVAGSVTFSSPSPQIHYDMALRDQSSNPNDPAFHGVNANAPYTVTAWTEITPP